MKASKHTDEHVLRNVLGVFTMAKHAKAEPENHALEFADKRAQARLVTSQTSFDHFDLTVNHAKPRYP